MSYAADLDLRRGMFVASLAALGFLVSWYLIHHGWFALDHEWDTIEYARYAHNILDRGLVPYRDFAVEYPPLAIPVFVIPAAIAGRYFSGYMEAFGLGMAVCGALAAVFSMQILVARRVSSGRLLAGLALIALSPLLLGPVLLSRYDLFPTMLATAALAALFFGWSRSGFALLALGAAAKAYPAVIVPIAAVYVWRTAGPRKAIACLTIFAAVLLVCFVPFLIIAPHGIWWAVSGQASRPPQIESLAASAYLLLHQLTGAHIALVFSHRSDNISNHRALQLASLTSLLQLASLMAVWLLYARGSATRERMLMAAAAAVCAFIAFDRVLSPQYLIWLAPLVVILPGKRGVAAMAMLAIAMCMTQIWYPEHFEQLKELRPLESWAVIGRDLLLVALFATLASPEAAVRRSLRSMGGRSGPIGRVTGALTAKDAV